MVDVAKVTPPPAQFFRWHVTGACQTMDCGCQERDGSLVFLLELPHEGCTCKFELVVCEVCGEPALAFVNDIQEVAPKPDDEVKQFEIHSSHTFCLEHDRESITYPLEYPNEPISIE